MGADVRTEGAGPARVATGRTRIRALLGVVLPLAVTLLALAGPHAGPAHAKAGKEKPPPKAKPDAWPNLSVPSEAQTKAVVDGLASGDAAARDRAAADLTRLGPGALRAMLRELPLRGGADAEAAMLKAMDGWGPEVALATLLTERSTYAMRYEKEVADLLAALRKRRPAHKSARSLTLEAAALDDPDRVPPALAAPVVEALTLPGLTPPVPARVGPEGLALDLARDGAFATVVLPAKPAVVQIAVGARTRSAVVWWRLDRWWAAPADLRVGLWGTEPVAVLDMEGDGRFDGPGDLARFGDGAFRSLDDGDTALVGDVIVRFQVKSVGAATHLDGAPEPEVAGVPAGVRDGLLALNRWRKNVGLPPYLLDTPRSKKCQAHVEYWRANGFSGHNQDRAKTGWSEEGVEAGAASVVSRDEPVDTVRVNTATIVHRLTMLGEASDGCGLGAGAGTCLWGGTTDRSYKRHPACAPGPGHKDVPTSLEAEVPDPQGQAGFYRTLRGYPVTLMWGQRLTEWTDIRMELWLLGAKPARLPGVVFAPGAAYLAKDPSNGGSVAFVPDKPLAGKQAYLARVTATAQGQPVHLEWSFRTK